MTILIPMRAQAFVAFAEASIADFAHDNVQAGRWLASDALQRARAEFDRLLPQGLHTSGHHFHEIQDAADTETVGYLWFALQETDGVRSGYVYNIRIKPEFRGRGHAKAALELGERLAVAEGASGIGLHVFAFNTSAQALYRSLGYGITGLNMFKRILADRSSP